MPDRKKDEFKKVREAAMHDPGYDPKVLEQQRKWYSGQKSAEDDLTEEDFDGSTLADPNW